MRISIAGEGFVGLITAMGLARLGHRVTVGEIDAQRRRTILAGNVPFREPGLDGLLQGLLAEGSLKVAESAFQAALPADISIIAVGTPDRNGRIDLAQIRQAALEIGTAMRLHRKPRTVVVKSTVVPGTTQDVVLPILLSASARPRSSFGLAMSPAFLREGTALEDFLKPDRIVLGVDDPQAASALQQLYADFDCAKIETNSRSAEMIKYMNNALLSTLVSFSNEMASYAEAAGDIDFDAVVKGVHADRNLTTHTGAKPGIVAYLKPSAGFGGSCLPKDIAAFRASAREAGISTPLLDGVVNANERRAPAIVGLLAQAIALQGARVALLGAASKAGTDDLRFAASLRVADMLQRRQAEIIVHDPLCEPSALSKAFRPDIAVTTSLEEAVTQADAAIVLTPAAPYKDAPWDRLAGRMRGRTLVDVWNVCGTAAPHLEVLRPGFGVRMQPEEGRPVAGWT